MGLVLCHSLILGLAAEKGTGVKAGTALRVLRTFDSRPLFRDATFPPPHHDAIGSPRGQGRVTFWATQWVVAENHLRTSGRRRLLAEPETADYARQRSGVCRRIVSRESYR